MSDNAELDFLYDQADREFREAMDDRAKEIYWALAECARAGSPIPALEVLESATGVHL